MFGKHLRHRCRTFTFDTKQLCSKKDKVDVHVYKRPKASKNETEPEECKNKEPPVYNECPKPNVDVCRRDYLKAPPPEVVLIKCKETIRKDIECKPNLDCPYDKGPSFGTNLKKALIALGTFLIAYKLYENYYKPKEVKEKTPVVVPKKKRCIQPQVIVKDPRTSEEIPSEIKYLLIGGGTASFSAYKAIKTLDPKARILIISNEPFIPYMRPPLSKGLYENEDREVAKDLQFEWAGKKMSVYFEPSEYYTPVGDLKSVDNGGVSVAKGWEVKELDILKKQVKLDDGKVIKYDKCLIATGGTPKSLPILENSSDEVRQKITLFRNIFDFREIEDVFGECDPSSVAIIGGGFLGTDLAVSLAKRGGNKVKITQIIHGDGPLSKVLPAYLSQWSVNNITKEGVEVVTGVEVEDIVPVEDQLRIILSNDSSVIADHVIVAMGIKPNTDFSVFGLELDKGQGGYLVNAQMLARSDLYVAGDCASFYDEKLDERRRDEHHDSAMVTGRIAGENMAGKPSYYDTQAAYRSGVGSLGFEAIGIVDASLPTVAVFAKPEDPEEEKESEYNKGVIFYLKDDILVGIILWNLFDKLHIARQLLKEKKKHEDLNDVAKLFSIHGQDSSKSQTESK